MVASCVDEEAPLLQAGSTDTGSCPRNSARDHSSQSIMRVAAGMTIALVSVVVVVVATLRNPKSTWAPLVGGVGGDVANGISDGGSAYKRVKAAVGATESRFSGGSAPRSQRQLDPSPEDLKPFVGMGGMFVYDEWSQGLVEENQDDRPLLQNLDNYGAAVDWSTIRSALNTGLGAVGRRKLFLFIRHGKAMHNEWGMIQHHTHLIDDIPCDYKSHGDLVDPDLTKQGSEDQEKYVHDVFAEGLNDAIGNRAKVFSSPLSRCMESSLIMMTNQSGLSLADDKVTVSELLRERIDSRVPFEVRRPVSFRPWDDTAKRGHSSAKTVNESQAGTSTAVGGTPVVKSEHSNLCILPSQGLTGHRGKCCVTTGLVERFGKHNLFDINVAGPSHLNAEATEQKALILESGQEKPQPHASCGLREVATHGWEQCTGPEMLGLLAQNDLAMAGHEEQEEALVERVRTWFGSVFDEVDEKVVIAVTHSDWIKLALRDLDFRKPWVVPRNSEIFPIIVEDVRATIPGWVPKRDEVHVRPKVDASASEAAAEQAIAKADTAARIAAEEAVAAEVAEAERIVMKEQAEKAARAAKEAEEAAVRAVAMVQGSSNSSVALENTTAFAEAKEVVEESIDKVMDDFPERAVSPPPSPSPGEGDQGGTKGFTNGTAL